MDFYNLPKDLFQFCFMRAFLSLIDLCDEGDVVFEFFRIEWSIIAIFCVLQIYS